MDVPVALSYARKPGRSNRRKLIWSIALGLMVGAAYWGYQILSWRVVALQTSPEIGPVDWGAVLCSPTLLKLAWQLAENPKWADNPKFFGLSPGAVQVELKHPFEFKDGKVYFELTIINRGSNPIVVPPFTWSGTIPRETGSLISGINIFVSRWLGNGVRVVDPGKSVILTLPVSADSRPALTDLTLQYGKEWHSFLIWAGGGLDQIYPYAEWKEIPKSAIQAHVRRRR